jgi:uncharacterized protein YodC (DUF2158 family)
VKFTLIILVLLVVGCVRVTHEHPNRQEVQDELNIVRFNPGDEVWHKLTGERMLVVRTDKGGVTCRKEDESIGVYQHAELSLARVLRHDCT